jgi:anaphase-promoting complex subunit 8
MSTIMKHTSLSSPFKSPGGMSMSSSVNMELEVPWNPSQVFCDLQKACKILSERCLKLSAKWAAEQLMGLSIEASNNLSSVEPSKIYDHLLFTDTTPAALYSRTLLELGEYAHAAAVLSAVSLSNSCSIKNMPPPSPDLSPSSFYLRAYALYMDGERRKEEKCLESKQKAHIARNPHLSQLLQELQEAYQLGELDAFGLHVYGMVLKSGKKSVLPRNAPTPQSVLMQSILLFPYNWSAWLDLAQVALEDREVEREIEQVVGSALAENFMYHFFCAHLQAEHQVYPTALAIYERWLDPAMLGGSPYLATQSAVVHYHLRNFAKAQALLEDLHNAMPYRLDSMDVFSNILYVQEDSVGLGQLAHTAVQVDKYRAETCCIVGNYYSLKQQRAKAIQYFQRALKMDRTFTSAWTLMGHEYVEWKQTANAMESYRQAVQVNPGDYRAWYGLGQTYELLEMHLYALYYYKQAAQLRPFDARMWTAVGHSYSCLKRTKHAIRAFERALQQDDTEGIATQKLASLYRQEGSDEMAAQCYLQHLQNRYNMTHARSASAEPVNLDAMLQGLFVEAAEAEALLYLANYYRDNAEYDMAAMMASRLLEYPGPEKESAKALLREIRSRKAMASRRVIHTRSRGPVAESSPFEFSP